MHVEANDGVQPIAEKPALADAYVLLLKIAKKEAMCYY